MRICIKLADIKFILKKTIPKAIIETLFSIKKNRHETF